MCVAVVLEDGQRESVIIEGGLVFVRLLATSRTGQEEHVRCVDFHEPLKVSTPLLILEGILLLCSLFPSILQRGGLMVADRA